MAMWLMCPTSADSRPIFLVSHVGYQMANVTFTDGIVQVGFTGYELNIEIYYTQFVGIR